MHLFLVTSLINLAHSTVYNPAQRLEQTIVSIKSIREKCSCSYICLLEGASLSPNQKKILIKLVDDIFVFDVSSFSKSCGECMLLYSYLTSNQFKNTAQAKEFITINKLSGRYYLNDDFIFLPDYETSVIKCDDSRAVYETRYYRFHIKHLAFFLEKLNYTIQNMYVAVEHAFYKHKCIPDQKIQYPTKLGISGNIAPTGQFITD